MFEAIIISLPQVNFLHATFSTDDSQGSLDQPQHITAQMPQRAQNTLTLEKPWR